MSHIATVDLDIKDMDALKKACEQLGLELVEGKKTYKWYGTSVGDYPLPAGFSKEDLGKCDHVIRIPGNSTAYEIGVVAKRDGTPGYQLMWDFWQGGYGMEKIAGKNGNNIRQQYAAQVAMKELRRNGYRVSMTTRPAMEVKH